MSPTHGLIDTRGQSILLFILPELFKLTSLSGWKWRNYIEGVGIIINLVLQEAKEGDILYTIIVNIRKIANK